MIQSVFVNNFDIGIQYVKGGDNDYLYVGPDARVKFV